MKTIIPIVILLALLAGGCDKQASRAAAEAEKCQLAESNGRLDVAELACGLALSEVDPDRLEPETRSHRLFRLGRIKRQLGKFAEADALIRQSLVIEQTFSATREPELGRRLLELSLSLAGQGHWEEGAQVLERLLPLLDRLPENERLSAVNILRSYSVQLRKTGDTQRAERFAAEAADLKTKYEEAAD